MPTSLRIAKDNLFSDEFYVFPINPIQPRGLSKLKPVSTFSTLSGSGGVQMPKDHFPAITFKWPGITEKVYKTIRIALEDRRYADTGLEYFIGIVQSFSIDDGWMFPTTNKFIKVRILNVTSFENPIDNNIDQMTYDLIMTALWVDAP